MIEAKNLTKRYGGATAVDDLTFTVQPGVVTGFLGPNGSGKSTTMRMIVGLDTPSSGTATIGGKRYRDLAHPLREVGCLLDASWAHTKRSARSHLAMQAAAGGLDKGRVDEMLDLVGLTDVAGKKVGGFSLGMRQRLGLASAMLGDPQILLFDEPVNGLDPEGIVWIRRFMHARAAEGRTVLVSSHLLSEMAQTAQDLIVIGRGRLRAQTSVDAFVSGASSVVVVRTPDAERFERAATEAGLAPEFDRGAGVFRLTGGDPARVGELAARDGIVLHELREQKASLEEAFMALTDEDVQYGGGGHRGGARPVGAPPGPAPTGPAVAGPAPSGAGRAPSGPPQPGYLPTFSDDREDRR